MPRGNILNHLHGTKASWCPRTASENLKCPQKVSVLLPRIAPLLGYFSKLEKTPQATRSGEAVSYPTLLTKRCKNNQSLPLENYPLASSIVQRDRMADSGAVVVYWRDAGPRKKGSLISSTRAVLTV